eukprot:TRINITY_DN7572_c0_g1_i1.p1 TRINITY_DN7572_c0_g1~~TRINITY_DN7572_c0_g1_i1.p1  ORF type:complete len:208 (-),score=38.80 TRINITY_DN7572_c0_g1_i1:38-661(-)
MASADHFDWDDVNYPPCINAFHYEPNGLQLDEQRFLVKFQRYHFFGVTFVNIYNLIVMIVLLAVGTNVAGLFSSICVLLFMLIFGGFLHIQIFRAVATGDIRKLQVVLVLMGINTVLMLLLALIGGGCFQGWFNLGNTGGDTAWTIVSIIEAALWTLMFLFQLFLVYKYYVYISSGHGQTQIKKKKSMKKQVKDKAVKAVVKNTIGI